MNEPACARDLARWWDRQCADAGGALPDGTCRICESTEHAEADCPERRVELGEHEGVPIFWPIH